MDTSAYVARRAAQTGPSSHIRSAINCAGRVALLALGVGLSPGVASADTTPSGCRYPQLNSQDHLALVGSYEGTPSRFQIPKTEGGETGELKLLIAPAGKPLHLVLNAYEPTIWRIGAAPGGDIRSVTVFGYYDQIVVGVPPTVPIIIHVYERSVEDWSRCLLSQGEGGGGVFSRKDAILANDAAQKLFGKGFDSVTFANEAHDRKAGILRLGQDKDDWSAAMANLPTDQAVAALAPPTNRPIGMSQAQWELSELAENGYLRPASSADRDAWTSAWRARMDAKNLAFDPGPAPFRARELRGRQGHGIWYISKLPPEGQLPAGLTGANSVAFIVDPALSADSVSGGGHSTFYYIADGSCQGPGPEECRRRR